MAVLCVFMYSAGQVYHCERNGTECRTALLHVWVLLCGSSLGVHCGACVGSWQQMQVPALCDIIAVPCLRICEGLDC
jgi:hypothetical protein